MIEVISADLFALMVLVVYSTGHKNIIKHSNGILRRCQRGFLGSRSCWK
nr:MAG TPA: hypothetical protein [Caudoviricetes sp.]